jgi:uncharacterized damage-inducible protein DinB
VFSKIFEDNLFANVSNDIPKNPYFTLTSFKNDRVHLDQLLIQFSNELTASDLDKQLEYIGRDNKNHERSITKVLIHMFNHQTHHRGQVSQILDSKKIENDFSNMIRLDI